MAFQPGEHNDSLPIRVVFWVSLPPWRWWPRCACCRCHGARVPDVAAGVAVGRGDAELGGGGGCPTPPSICRRSLFSDRLSHTGTATPVFPPDDVVTPRRVPPGFLGPFRLPTHRLPLSDLRAVAGGVPLGPGCRRSVQRAITE